MCGDYTTESEKENDDLLEKNFMTIFVKTINGETISFKCEGKMTAAVISDEVERRSSIPWDMTHLVHKGKVMNEKKTIKENNMEAEATIEMSLRLLGGMEKNGQMDTPETEEEREKKRKLEEGKEGKMTKPNDDTAYLRRDILEATQERLMKKWKATQGRLTKKIENYSKKTDDRMDDFSRKADEMLEKPMPVTNTVGSQIQGMNSSIVKMQEMNEKMKEEGEDRYKQFNERITNMERKILDMDEKRENRSEDNKKEHVGEDQGKTVIAGFHSETTESEITQLLKEMINEIGMDFGGSARIECPAKPITHAFIHFVNDGERNKFIKSANMLKKELRGRKIKITRSMDAEERFHNKRMVYVKILHS